MRTSQKTQQDIGLARSGKEKKMKLTESKLKKLIIETMTESAVPQEAKEKLFVRMKRAHQVPSGATIEHAEFWEVKDGDYGFRDNKTGEITAIKVDGKYYYGEI